MTTYQFIWHDLLTGAVHTGKRLYSEGDAMELRKRLYRRYGMSAHWWMLLPEEVEAMHTAGGRNAPRKDTR